MSIAARPRGSSELLPPSNPLIDTCRDCHVLEETETILHERATDPNEFWHLQAFAQYRSFWRSQALAANRPSHSAGVSGPLFPRAETYGRRDAPESAPGCDTLSQAARPAVARTGAQAGRRDEYQRHPPVPGRQAILFPGDAQIENWAFALQQKKYQELLAGSHCLQGRPPREPERDSQDAVKPVQPPPHGGGWRDPSPAIGRLTGERQARRSETEDQGPARHSVAALDGDSEFFTTDNLEKSGNSVTSSKSRSRKR